VPSSAEFLRREDVYLALSIAVLAHLHLHNTEVYFLLFSSSHISILIIVCSKLLYNASKHIYAVGFCHTRQGCARDAPPDCAL
jgi:hypothetical protein